MTEKESIVNSAVPTFNSAIAGIFSATVTSSIPPMFWENNVEHRNERDKKLINNLNIGAQKR